MKDLTYPISPEYVSTAPEPLSRLYEQLEESILAYICEQFKQDSINATAIELIKQLQRRGLPLGEIESAIRRTTGLSEKEMARLYEDAISRNESFYGGVLDKLSLVGDTTRHAALQAEISAIVKQTGDDVFNITQSLGFAIRNADGTVSFRPIADAYQAALNKASVSVWAGANDYNSAIRVAIRELTDSGLQTIDYETGWHNRVDVAARRAVMTGIAQISAKYSDALMEEIDTPYLEVTAHRGARDIDGPNGWENHKRWQGKVYSKNDGDIYPSVYSVCGLGDVTGLNGANCRHKYHAFVPGVMEPSYTQEELDNIDPPPIEFEGRKYTMYEATQKQRQVETALRNIKRRMIGYDSAGQTEQYQQAAAKYRRLQDEYGKFSKAADLPMRYERLEVEGFGPKEHAKAMKSQMN